MTARVRFDFTGQTVLVTGSSRNIGRIIADSFLRAGASTVYHGSSTESLAQVRRELAPDLASGAAVALPSDLSTKESIDSAFEVLAEQGRMPDILVNNAVNQGLGDNDFLGQADEFFRSVFEVNIFAVRHCSALAAREMHRRGSGHIINISSLAGTRPLHGRSAYDASKAALNGLTRAMAVELAPLGVTVNAIAPGYVWTERWNDLPSSVVERRKKNTALGEPTHAEEIAALTMFLATGSTPTLLGAVIPIDAGIGARQLPPDIGL